MKRLLLEQKLRVLGCEFYYLFKINMKTLKVTVAITKNGTEGYICTCDYPFKHFDLGGSGSTIEEAKNDCFTFYDEMKSEYPKENFPELDVSWVQVSNFSLLESEPVEFSR